ncbi:MAG: hypothetical protein ABEH80_00795 [Halobaculum sp.]
MSGDSSDSVVGRLARLFWIVVTTVGLSALGGAVAVAVAPERVVATLPALEPVVGAASEFDGTILLAVTAGFVGLAATLLSRSGRAPSETTDQRMDARRSRPVESVAVRPGTVTGDGIDRTYDAVEDPDDLGTVAESLQSTAVAVEAAAAGVDRETASERVADGEWTDDEVAAAVLGDSVPLPVTARLRGWLDTEAETRRRLRRTVDALDRRMEGADGD